MEEPHSESNQALTESPIYNVEDATTQHALLKLGYAAQMLERYPINQDFRGCSTAESAYFWHLEETYCCVPEHLSWPNIQNSIPESHHERLEAIWKKVKEHEKKYAKNVKALSTKLENAPMIVDEEIEAMMTDTPLRIADKFQQGVAAMIFPTEEREGDHSFLETWQCEEKGLREQIYKEQKTYLVALRLYYEMLLENQSIDEQNKEFVLPENHPNRMEIVIRNRYLRILDATYQAITAAKAAHHQQDKRRLRKTGNVPYVTHSSDVTLRLLLDTIPHFIEQDRLNYDPVAFASAGPVHDVSEDTALTIIRLFEDFVDRLTDKYDSSLDQVIKSGFEKRKNDDPDGEIIKNGPDHVKRKILNLLGRGVKSSIKKIMRVVSNNTPLSNAEKMKALSQSSIPFKRVQEELEITEMDLKSWRVFEKAEDIDSHPMFEMFPEEYDGGKITRFLIRLESIPADVRDRQIALMLKIEDRAHNISTLKGMPPLKQRNYIRATITRLIAYIMMQDDNEEYPLYNTTARLIDTTVREYERLWREHSDILDAADSMLHEQLEIWQTAVKRYEVPHAISGVLNEYHAGSIRHSELSTSDSREHSKPNLDLALAETDEAPVDPRLKELAAEKK